MKNNLDVFANYYALQIKRNWITIEKVPKKFRARVEEILKETEEGGK